MHIYSCGNCGGTLSGPDVYRCPYCGVLLRGTREVTEDEYLRRQEDLQEIALGMLLKLRPDTPKTDHNRRGKSRNWGRIMLVSARTVFGGLFFGVLASERFGLTGALIGFILGALLGYYGWNPIWPAESETSKPPPDQSKEPPVHLININTARVEELVLCQS